MKWPYFITEEISTYIKNINGKLEKHCIDGEEFTTFYSFDQDSWNTSIPHYYIDFHKKIIEKSYLKNKHKFFYSLIIAFLKITAILANIKKSLFYNHNFTTTNLWDDEINIEKKLIYLKNRYPNKAIIFRSLNNIHHQDLIKRMIGFDIKLTFFRHTICFNCNAITNKKFRKNLKKDIQQIEKNNYKVIHSSDLNEEDFDRIYELYKSLYLKKYDTGNAFTKKFFKEIIQDESYQIIGLKKEQVDAFRLYQIENGKIQAPCLGYDFDKNHQFQLYRQLSGLWPEILNQHKAILNWSSGHKGVREFKLSRGGTETPEYYGIYVKHLPLTNKFFWTIFIYIINTFYKKIHWEILSSGREI